MNQRKRVGGIVMGMCVLGALAATGKAVPPAGHTSNEHGVMHANDKKLPYTSHCTDCHASDLTGGLGPSCYACHGVYWRAWDSGNLAPPLDHNVSKGPVRALHKPGFGTPLDSGCTDCHGPNLNDGFAPSCYTCHGRIWAGEGPPADHTEIRGGFAAHQPGLGDPFGNKCTQCHGPNLDDGFAPSCYTCHGPVWEGTEGHHMPGRIEPWTNCVSCHGDDLLGGTSGVACNGCHNDFSPPDPPAPGHHFPGRETPVASNCTACHGSELQGDLGPSCYQCHDAVWEAENLPPIADAGGPYQGKVNEPLVLDGSATVDVDGDPLSYQWDFGDGSEPTAPSSEPTAAHTYTTAGQYTAVLTVSDGVNLPVAVEAVVKIAGDSTGPPHDRWVVTLNSTPTETFGLVFVNQSGALVGTRDDGVNPPSFSFGIEFPGVIWWMDLWIDIQSTVTWGVGNTYFGNIDREAGTIQGFAYAVDGNIFTFSATASPE